ncbi:hypothetical protein L198_07060 [Cryptococcus wingfieldii CBS 7118]|uniref:Cupin type-2 domain-containing protein n=1 Tax=Cryptococcus wingfieldii CBS 7118 TaxID=1295528 RepID=A0A1E3IFQ5_9TREE|nr:hypothetical protein L198_07060 [Cryptococcus wingfieldii CBS 7118]ODN87433.1 hypothetical protein L198_07060 [Cryptococcus wingfieldii CBS 7118]
MSITHVTSASLQTSGGQTGGMDRRNALVGISDQLSGSLMISQPHTISAIHHHQSQDTIIYSISGRGALITLEDGIEVKREMNPGDWALIPAGVEHQEANVGEDEVHWVIVRGGRVPEVKNVEGWST